MNQEKAVKVTDLLKKQARVIIITHHNPDGDAIGSALGLYHFVKALNAHTMVMVPNDIPAFLQWMPSCDKIFVASHHPEKAATLLEEAGLIFCLDFNAPSRVEHLQKSLEQSKAIKVVIDHHPQPQDFADYLFSDVTASSTCEMILDFADAAGLQENLNRDVAACLYTGIMTDTGSFKFHSCTAKTHIITARLLSTGINKTIIHQEVLDTNSINRLRMLGNCLMNSLQVFPEIRTAIMHLSKEDQDHFRSAKGDTEGFVNYCLSLKGIDLAAMFIENAEYIKISFRSKNSIDVNQIARNFFNGGGHTNAAGGKAYESLADCQRRFIDTIHSHASEIL